MSNGVNPCDIHGRPTRFLRTLYQQKYCLALALKGTRKKTVEGTPKKLQVRDKFIKMIQLEACVTFCWTARVSLRVGCWPGGRAGNHRTSPKP